MGCFCDKDEKDNISDESQQLLKHKKITNYTHSNGQILIDNNANLYHEEDKEEEEELEQKNLINLQTLEQMPILVNLKKKESMDHDAGIMDEYLINGFFRECKSDYQFNILKASIIIEMKRFINYEIFCLYIDVFDTKKTIRITVHPTCTILKLKEIVYIKEGIDTSKQFLQITDGEKPLTKNDLTLSDYNIHKIDHIELKRSFFEN